MAPTEEVPDRREILSLVKGYADEAFAPRPLSLIHI